jgi:glucuronate isomerase
LLEHFRVAVVCTTDDPVDTLEHHRSYAASPDAERVRMYPTFRPDRALRVDEPAEYGGWLTLLEAASDRSIDTYQDLLSALAARHQAFHDLGCRASDHGLDTLYAEPAGLAQVTETFARARSGQQVSERAARHPDRQ